MFVGGRAGELPFSCSIACKCVTAQKKPTRPDFICKQCQEGNCSNPTKSVTVAVDSPLIYVWSHGFSGPRTPFNDMGEVLCVCGAVNQFQAIPRKCHRISSGVTDGLFICCYPPFLPCCLMFRLCEPVFVFALLNFLGKQGTQIEAWQHSTSF